MKGKKYRPLLLAASIISWLSTIRSGYWIYNRYTADQSVSLEIFCLMNDIVLVILTLVIFIRSANGKNNSQDDCDDPEIT